MQNPRTLICLMSIFISSSVAGYAQAESSNDSRWKKIGVGLEYSTQKVRGAPRFGDGRLHIVRIDPSQVAMRFGLAKDSGGVALPAADWCKKLKFAVAINAGMFQSDHLKNVGYLRAESGIQNSKWNSYQSVLAFSPVKKGIPPAVMIDLDDPKSNGQSKSQVDNYANTVQNLRLIKNSGINVWKKQNKSWSESAIAQDEEGRVLFLFSRSPLSMAEFNEMILKSGLGIRRAMHVEGGPEASLSIHTGGVDMDLHGSYETGFMENDDNLKQWPLPNVIGVVREVKKTLLK